MRDWLLLRQHLDPWRGLVDLDLVIEQASALGRPAARTRHEKSSPAWQLVQLLTSAGEGVTVRDARPHGQYGTVELELELGSWQEGLPPSEPTEMSRLLLDVATARGETYPCPGENPLVWFGSLEDDLSRRDLTINAMAIDLTTGSLIDPHGGQADLAERSLRFLHANSLQDDPTRLVRAARYSARIDFQLAPESLSQAMATLAAWPWPWRGGDPPQTAPAALGTRLRRELDLLLERENWWVALGRLQEWGGLVLLDPSLQADQHWARRLHWATRLNLPLLMALLATVADPLAVAERLQVPHRQHQVLRQLGELRRRLAKRGPLEGRMPSTPWQWCQFLESPPISPSAVALALACGVAPRRPLLRWYWRWRHLGPEVSAEELIAAGVPKGPELGEQLRRSRQRRLERERP